MKQDGGFFIDLWLCHIRLKIAEGGFGIFCFSMGSFLLGACCIVTAALSLLE